MSRTLAPSAEEFLRHRRAALAQDDERIGLDFLEVLPDPDDPAGRLLVLHFIPGGPGKLQVPARLDPESFRFTIGDVPVDGLFTLDVPGGLMPPGRSSVTVRMGYAGDTDLARRLGSAPVFTLELVGVPHLDPFFSRLDLSLELDAPLEEDCLPDCPPASSSGVASAPLAGDYLAKDYASFRQRMLDHLAQTLPEWSERSPADLLVTLVELLADAADQASYYQDAVATEAYLGTARLRTSVRRHARLVGYRMHEGVNARVWAHLDADLAPGETAVLPAGTQLLTRTSGLFDPESLKEARALASGPTVFETLHAVDLRREHNAIPLYDWGAADYVLPRGATAAALQGDFSGTLLPGAVLILEQVLGETTGEPADADRALRHAVRLTRVAADEDPLAAAAVALTRVEWQAGDALPFPLPLAAILDGEVVRDMAVARGNVVLADHGRTVSEELAVPDLADRPFRPRLQGRGLTWSAPYDPAAALDLPAAAALAPPASAARPALALTEDEGSWTLRRDLLGSDRFARDFVVEMEQDGTATLRFGDGALGRPPAPGTTLTATYRIGSGAAGNIGRDSLVQLLVAGLGETAVRNPLPATGGVDPEPIDAARLAAPGSIDLAGGSAIDDVVALALAHPEVERAAAGLRWTGSWYLLEVAVQRRGGLPAEAGFLAEVRAGLEDSRIAGWELAVIPLTPVGLDIALTVRLDADAVRGRVERELLELFSNRDLPGGRRGFFHPANLGFGETVYLSRIVQAALAVPGVRAVDLDDRPPRRFRRFGEPSRGELAAGEIRLGRGELARVDNDPAFPQNGIFELFLEGGR